MSGGADEALDVQLLQTASSLEVLVVATYGAALSLSAVRSNPLLARFVQSTLLQHEEHRKAFQARTRTLGGKEQAGPHPGLQPVVDQAGPTLATPMGVVSLAEMLETVATQTYLRSTVQLDDPDSRRLMASVMGVEARHAAVLRTIKVLLEGNVPDLVRLPLGADVARLPAAAGSAAFPAAFEPVAAAVEPASGAVA